MTPPHPLEKSDDLDPPARRRPLRVGMTPLRVLVVDDHEPFRYAVAAVIDETVGFTVVGSARSGEQSLDLVRDVAADLVLMDVNLPGINGIEATRRLTARSHAPVVVLLSTYEPGEIDYDGCGAAAFITKSAFAPELLADVWAAARGDHP